MMTRIDLRQVKRTYATHIVPDEACVGYVAHSGAPRIGDLLLAEVISVGKHTAIETTNGLALNIFPGDLIIGAFGNRYVTDQYEGNVPALCPDRCDLLSIGGVCGEVCSAHSSMRAPTRLRVLGALCDVSGAPLNLRSFAASAAGKDGRFFRSCGADPVFDFTYCGVPSTYMLDQRDLLAICDDLFARLAAAAPDYSIIEIADGIFQRETRMLLASDAFCTRVDHVFFSAGDSLGAECGVCRLRADGGPIRAVTGLVTASPLALREVEEEAGTPCLSIDQLVYGEILLDLVGAPKAAAVGESQVFRYAA